MPTQVRRQIARLLSDKRHRREYLAALTLLAAIVATGVASVLTQQGHAATKEVQVLDCPVTGLVAHAHDESCYDGDGNLVCPLPEREAHTHDDSCYAEERVLVCGLEEGEDHIHTDECYEIARTLVCGMEEVTETHVHGAGCFKTVEVERPDAEPVQDQAEVSATDLEGTTSDDGTRPAQSFEHDFKDADGNLVLRVEVEAPEGALSKGTTMVARLVDPDSLSQKQQDAVDAAIAKKADGQVLGMQAVDISFRDASGAEVEPAEKVTVTMASGLIDTEDQALVVHIDDLTEAQKKAQEQALSEGKTAEEAEPDRTAQAVEALSDEALADRDVATGDDRLSFDSDKFSTYVLAVTSLHKVMQASDGATVTVTVDAPAEAGIPQGAELQIREVTQGDSDWQDYEREALHAIGTDEAELARFFDITIVSEDGVEIHAAEPVSVQIELADAPVAGDASVVHFGDTTEVIPATEDAGVATFDAASFSVYGVVYTVDFHWTVDGKEFEWNLQGGSVVGLRELLPILGAVEESEVGSFVSDIANVEFSDPSLVAVAHIDEDTTAGELKGAHGLHPTYSSELSQQDIAEMDARQLVAPDWALVALNPFTSEETLTVTMTNGDQWTIRVTDWVEGAYGQSVNIDIYGDGSITLGEYVAPFDWGVYDHEERRTYYSYKSLSLSVRYGSDTNNQDIVANPASGYTFDHWELKDGSTGNTTTYSSAVISAGTLAFSHGSTLTAVFSKSSSGGGTPHIDFSEITQEWVEKITKDQPIVDKTASVYDYKNRIYQIDITASSELYAVNQNLDIDFVTDVSGSMLFPSKLESVATFTNAADLITQLKNVVKQNHNGTLPYSTPVGENYYLTLDPDGASNVFVVRRYNGQWWCIAAAYSDDEINASVIQGKGYDNWRPLNVEDSGSNVLYTNITSQNTVEKKIYVATDITKRLEYLQQALYLARDVLYNIDPDAKIGLTTFAATANQGQFYTSTQQNALTNAIRNIATAGGTNQADGLAKGKALLDSDTDNTKKKIAVLITDGAPNGCTWDQIKQNSQSLKNDGIDVYTVGLSVENVHGASDGLYETSSGHGYAFDAKDGRGLVEAIESIIESIVTKANMTGTVTDTIDPAFYPVDKNGTPLQPGVEYEDENGHKFTLAKNGESWTVTWADQSFGWAYTDMEGQHPGWQGTVYVKAKENFLGGNAIKTNSGTSSDKVTVSGFETFTYNDDDELVILNSGPLKTENGQVTTVDKPLSTPYVNVDELALTENSTEWNVYLGTEVDPKSALKELLKKIDVRKVVSGDTNEMITSSSQMLGGTSDESKTMALTDCLGLTEAQVQALANDLLANKTKTYPYNNSSASAYGHGYVGDIVITLEDVSGCYNKGNHATEAVGKDAEFTLKVAYLPRTNAERNSALGITNDDYHTTPGGSAGTPVPKTGNDMSSTNHHVINVYVKGLQITKKDQSFSTKLTGAEFKLYRTARAGETQNLKEIGGKNYYPVATLNMSSSSVATINSVEALRAGEQYYLVETKAPAGYLMLAEPIPVNLTFTNTYTPKPNGTATSDKPASGPYDWQQSATLTLGTSSWVRRTDATGENDLTQTGLDPSAVNETMYYDVANDSGVELPAAGGPGTGAVRLAGAVLAVAGAFLAMARRRNVA